VARNNQVNATADVAVATIREFSPGDIVSRTTRALKGLTDAVGCTDWSSADLSRATELAAEITHMIDDIVDQTNLLALNTSLASRRTGGESPGLAAIADEIRQVAEHTNQATSEILHIMNRIPSKVDRQSQAIETGVLGPNDISQSLDRAGCHLRELISKWQQMSDKIALRR